MPKSNVNQEPTDGNTRQWDKLKSMREQKDAKERGESGTPVQVIGVPNADAPPPAEPPPAAAAPVPDATGRLHAPDGKFAEKPPEAPPPVAAAPVVPPPTTPPPPTAPSGIEVEIDGQKVVVAPEIAEAFKKAGDVKKENAAAEAREKLKAELREELKKELAPPPKSAAELAAEEALRVAEEEKALPQKPDINLAISDPVEFEKQRETYEAKRTQLAIDRAMKKSKDETLAEVRARDVKVMQDREEQARGILREQFYQAYPSLRASEEVVDIVLGEKFTELVNSGKLTKPLQPAEQEALKKVEFADVATRATRKLVKIMSAGKTVIPPTPPPAVVSSAPTRQPGPPKEPEERSTNPAAKYPKGSISAALAERRAKQAAAVA